MLVFKNQNHDTLLTQGFYSNLRFGEFCDCVLIVDDNSEILAHRAILSLSSAVLAELFKQTPLLKKIKFPDTSFNSMLAVLQFMYTGNLTVNKDDSPAFIRLARSLQVMVPALNIDVAADLLATPNAIIPERFSEESKPPSNILTIKQEQGDTNISNGNTFGNSTVQVASSSEGVSTPQEFIDQFKNEPSSIAPFGQSNNATQPVSQLQFRQGAASFTLSNDEILNMVGPLTEFYQNNIDPQSSRITRSRSKTAQNTEWRRYKQYSVDDLNAAIQCVREGKMSALQASRSFGVPSRTLYDKIKKMGIDGKRARIGNSIINITDPAIQQANYFRYPMFNMSGNYGSMISMNSIMKKSRHSA